MVNVNNPSVFFNQFSIGQSDQEALIVSCSFVKFFLYSLIGPFYSTFESVCASLLSHMPFKPRFYIQTHYSSPIYHFMVFSFIPIFF
jgi:hypothetical protein